MTDEARARELAELIYVIIQHGDERHMAWLRQTLLEEAQPKGSIIAAFAAIREECAKVAERHIDPYNAELGFSHAAKAIAAAIRQPQDTGRLMGHDIPGGQKHG
jgi:hypothetical protein